MTTSRDVILESRVFVSPVNGGMLIVQLRDTVTGSSDEYRVPLSCVRALHADLGRVLALEPDRFPACESEFDEPPTVVVPPRGGDPS